MKTLELTQEQITVLLNSLSFMEDFDWYFKQRQEIEAITKKLKNLQENDD